MRFSGSISLSGGVSVGLNATYAQTTGGVTYGLGISGGLGTPGVGAGINVGNTVVK